MYSYSFCSSGLSGNREHLTTSIMPNLFLSLFTSLFLMSLNRCVFCKATCIYHIFQSTFLQRKDCFKRSALEDETVMIPCLLKGCETAHIVYWNVKEHTVYSNVNSVGFQEWIFIWCCHSSFGFFFFLHISRYTWYLLGAYF